MVTQPRPEAPGTSDRLGRSRRRAAWLFLSPMLVVLGLVAAYPLLRTIWLAFTDANLLELENAKGIGLDNFTGKYGLLHDTLWWQSVKNTLWFTVLTVTIETVLGMIIALVLTRAFPGRGLVRAAVLIPWAIPTVVSAKMWSWMLNDQFGIINHLLLTLGIIDSHKAWTADPDLVMASVVLVDVWKTTPFMALLILAALQMLPKECYEAAKIDGIHPVRVFFWITLPLIRPALMVAVIFRALDAIRIFDLVYVLTGTTESTMTMSVYARQQLIEFQRVGYGSAASTLLFFIVALLTVIYIYIGRVKLGND
jgi:trehalose/maltose transport system permease protein